MNARTQNQNGNASLTDTDLHLFNEGTHFRLYEKLGARVLETSGARMTRFAVWAPNAARVSVIGDFNGWDKNANPLSPHGSSGIWETLVGEDLTGRLYKFFIHSRATGADLEKSDPFAFHTELSPKTASIVWNTDYDWRDKDWMAERRRHNAINAPMSIYEVHLGSWRRVPEEGDRPLTYRELAPRLADYVSQMGFTHVEFMPVMEHPFYASWGYQVTGYFAPTSRYGTPQDLMYLIDVLHQRGIGVILDWVPSHFPADAHGLGSFDGTHLFEHDDPRQGTHPDWKSSIFNFGRHEVRSFLVSSALFWLDKYHADGLRVDGVASMLYLDYSRKPGEWVPNQFGGNENLDAISFLRRLNTEAGQAYPDAQIIAEDSSAWPMVSRPVHLGGLGFGIKWDMGWMNDTLAYFKKDPVYRRFHQENITFRLLYAFNENFLLPLSHDEVVHGKGSLLSKMPGDAWQKFANLRLLFGLMFGMNGKKLLFMGDEFGQCAEWNHDRSLDWDLLAAPAHAGLSAWVRDLCHLYRGEPALYERDCDAAGFEWADCHDTTHSVVSFLRRGTSGADEFLVVCNATPQPHVNYRIGVPAGGFWEEKLNSDAGCYGGSGMGNNGGFTADAIPAHGRPHSLNLTLPPLSVSFFKKRN